MFVILHVLFSACEPEFTSYLLMLYYMFCFQLVNQSSPVLCVCYITCSVFSLWTRVHQLFVNVILHVLFSACEPEFTSYLCLLMLYYMFCFQLVNQSSPVLCVCYITCSVFSFWTRVHQFFVFVNVILHVLFSACEPEFTSYLLMLYYMFCFQLVNQSSPVIC